MATQIDVNKLKFNEKSQAMAGSFVLMSAAVSLSYHKTLL